MALKNTNCIKIPFFKLFLTLFGLVFVWYGIDDMRIANEMNHNGETAVATITAITWEGTGERGNRRAIVAYEVNGTDYSGILNTYNSNMHVDDTLEIIYDIADPSQMRDAGNPMAGVWGIVFGLVWVLLVWSFSVVRVVLKYKQNQNSK